MVHEGREVGSVEWEVRGGEHVRPTRKRGRGPIIVVPRHVFDLVSDLGFEDVVEVDWWNSYRHAGLTVTHVPSRHWGARIIKDAYRGYGGYVLRAGKHSVYHAGDTAYFEGFSEIGARLARGPVLAENGTSWFMAANTMAR